MATDDEPIYEEIVLRPPTATGRARLSRDRSHSDEENIYMSMTSSCRIENEADSPALLCGEVKGTLSRKNCIVKRNNRQKKAISDPFASQAAALSDIFQPPPVTSITTSSAAIAHGASGSPSNSPKSRPPAPVGSAAPGHVRKLDNVDVAISFVEKSESGTVQAIRLQPASAGRQQRQQQQPKAEVETNELSRVFEKRRQAKEAGSDVMLTKSPTSGGFTYTDVNEFKRACV